MKLRLRLVFVLLMSLVLPINGMAALQLASARCSMGESGASHGALTGHEVHTDMRTVTADPAQHERDDNGALCADGQQCQTASPSSANRLFPALNSISPLTRSTIRQRPRATATGAPHASDSLLT